MLNTVSLLLFAGALLLLGTKTVPPAAVIVLSGICGIILF